MDAAMILAAKVEALRSLRDAMETAGHGGSPSMDFVNAWTQAAESMLPAEALTHGQHEAEALMAEAERMVTGMSSDLGNGWNRVPPVLRGE